MDAKITIEYLSNSMYPDFWKRISGYPIEESDDSIGFVFSANPNGEIIDLIEFIYKRKLVICRLVSVDEVRRVIDLYAKVRPIHIDRMP